MPHPRWGPDCGAERSPSPPALLDRPTSILQAKLEAAERLVLAPQAAPNTRTRRPGAGWGLGAAGPRTRLLQGLCDNCPERPHCPRLAGGESPQGQRAGGTGWRRTGQRPPKATGKHPSGPDRHGGRGGERLPEGRGAERPRQTGRKGTGDEMEFAWDPRVGWLAGPREPCGQMFAWSPGWKACGRETRPRRGGAGVRLHAQPLSPKARWHSLPGPRCPPARRPARARGPAWEPRPPGPPETSLQRARDRTRHRPGLGRSAPGGSHIPASQARKLGPGSEAAAGAGSPLPCPQQDGTGKGKQN